MLSLLLAHFSKDITLATTTCLHGTLILCRSMDTSSQIASSWVDVGRVEVLTIYSLRHYAMYADPLAGSHKGGTYFAGGSA